MSNSETKNLLNKEFGLYLFRSLLEQNIITKKEYEKASKCFEKRLKEIYV